MNNWTPKQGEMIEVNNSSNDINEDWKQRELIILIPHSQQAYLVYENVNRTIVKQYAYARTIKQAPETIKLWDVVETRAGNFGIVTGFRNADFVELYIPSLVCVNLFSLRELKLRKDKVAMAPATVTRLYIERAGGKWVPIKSERETFGLFSSIENARAIIHQFYSYNREDFAKTSSYVADESICWPHSIASMTIEDK